MSDNTRPTSRLLNVEEVSNYLGVRTSWIYDNWKAEGIPFLRIGGQLRARYADLERWLDSQQAA
ncbi:helix-turn-helix domain-containing protein [Actinocorallia libanotica]|uniref:Helix-turn-helix domain-containing protein n=1 Tax=Actinocorallia libanotica TaxID=46162 RepID=A0ABN1QQU6_9ACTN